MYREIVEILEAPFTIATLYLIFDILSNEIDELIWLDKLHNEQFLRVHPNKFSL